MYDVVGFKVFVEFVVGFGIGDVGLYEMEFF
jgi:hypothetical protein